MKRKNQKSLYCKEKNLLQLPIFYFGKSNKKEFQISWVEEDGQKCKMLCCSSKSLPGVFEMDIYCACMRLWVIQGMPKDGVDVQNRQIADILGLNYENWHTKIRKSILKLGAARYEFLECFVDAKSRKVKTIKQFSLFSGTEINEIREGKRKLNNYKLIFPEQVKINLEKRYYQWLDFELYKKIKNGIARRLYEFLEKRRYHSKDSKFTIAEEKIYRWIPITNVDSYYCRLTLQKAIECLIEVGYLKAGERVKKNWLFVYAQKIKTPKKKLESSSLASLDNKKEELEVLLSEVKKLTDNIKKIIENCLSEKGFDYVLWNIRYTNTKAKKNYLTYLRRALKENWAVDWKEEQLQMAVNEKLIEEEAANKYQEDMNEKIALDKQMALFEKEHNELAKDDKRQMWINAESLIDKRIPGRGMLVKIEYVKLIGQKLEQKGLQFDEKAISGLKFISKIAIEPKN